MSIERRQRDGRQLVTLAVKIVAVLGGLTSILALGARASSTMANTIRIAETSADSLEVAKKRIAAIETGLSDIGYMTCVLFADSHPHQVPASCSNYTR